MATTTCLVLNPHSSNATALRLSSEDRKMYIPVLCKYGEDTEPDADILNTYIGERIQFGPVYVFAHHDGGAQIVARWLLRYAGTSGFSNMELTFVVTIPPTKPSGRKPWTPTSFETIGGFPIIEIGQEGGWCEYADDPDVFELIIRMYIQSIREK